MANLTPTASWDNVFQLEKETPVLGGAGGVANRQAQELANRTQFLYENMGEEFVPTYAAMRAYNGNATRVQIGGRTNYFDGANGIAVRTGTKSDNDGTVWVDALGRSWERQFNGPVYGAWFGTKGDSATNNTTAFTNAIAVGKEVVVGDGEFLTNELDFRGKYIKLKGAGQVNTRIKAYGTNTNLINAEDSSDVQVSPFVIEAMTIDGATVTTNGINMRYRHHAVLRDVVITGCVNDLKEKDSWLVSHYNVRCDAATNGLWLVGANHNSLFERCSFIGSSGYQIKIESNGTVPDGNHGLCFNACDVEFGAGAGVYVDAVSVNFNSGYLGENIGGPIFTVANGVVSVTGGTLFFGHTVNSFGVTGTGGRVLVDRAALANQGALSVDGLIRGFGVKAKFEDVDAYTIVGGEAVMMGDCLDYGPMAKVFAPRYGKNYAKTEYNNSITETIVGKSKTFTVASTSGSPSILTASANLIDRDKWMDDAGLYFVVVYSSNAVFRARLAGAVLGTSPSKVLGDLPSTSGVVKTYIKLDGTLDSAAYNILEFYNDTATTGTSITLHEVFLADDAMLNKLNGSNFSNLYKC